MQDLACIVLCAGQGTRMKTTRSKMLLDVAGKPMCRWSLDLGHALGADPVVAVLGYQREVVARVANTQTVFQEQQLGTGHAVQVAFKTLQNFKGRVLVLYGDTPLLKQETLQSLVDLHRKSHADIAMLTAHVANPYGYGRIIREGSGVRGVRSIVEEREASEAQKKIGEINPGIYVFDADFLRQHLFALKTHPHKNEYYLTDLIALTQKPIASIEVPEEEILGVNDLVQLAHVNQIMRRRVNQSWMLAGVQMLDDKTTYIDAGVQLSPDVILEEGVVLRGDCQIGPGVCIGAYSILQDAHVGADCQVGPFARLRPGTVLNSGCKIGNFVEVKKSHFGKNSKASHLAYIGDTQIGEACNIGAGTITCNYDGEKKHETKIDDHVFIGSNSTLVAPVRLKKDSYVAAGSVITTDVTEGSLGVGRARQVNKEGWTKKHAKSLPRN